ncbi:hypothetical protein OTK49_02360 [Vibrio coralliirubri]|uniref:hypothetical protein n=1 Tax=Vibrio coralliirubri TaxID=1516159 RepID=UPI0022850411|nr:hypothetical protein [Vibrio coralliirubri]MCY9861359.1 hypothetical protein [Vibrio coralliirubri]
MEFQSSLTRLDASAPRGTIKPSTFINGSIFSYHAQVTTIQSFIEWLNMITEQSQRQLDRFQKKDNFKDDEMATWVSTKPMIFNEALLKVNECSSGDYTGFELWLRNEYEKAFTLTENGSKTNGVDEDYEIHLARKGALSDVLTNFVAGVLLDPEQNGKNNQLVSKSFGGIAAFPPTKWLTH